MMDAVEEAFNRPYEAAGALAFDIHDEIGGFFLGVSRAGEPALVIPLAAARVSASRVVGSIRLSFFSQLDFNIVGKRWHSPAAAIMCLDPELLPTFCTLARSLIEEIGTPPVSSQHVRRTLANWDRLLRHREALSLQAEMGLWGELALLEALPDVDGGLAAWRGPDGSGMDFVGGGIALEVKTEVVPKFWTAAKLG